jgi:tyrosine-protein kinase
LELREYLTILRRRWLVVLGSTLAAVAVAAGITAWTPRTYEAQTTSIVSVPGTPDQDPGSLYQGSQYTLLRASSYARSVRSPDVLEPVIDSLQLSTTTTDLAERISAENPPDTSLIQVKATDANPDTAAAIANAVAAQLAEFIQTLETPSGSDESAVKVTVTEPAVPPLFPASPRPALNIALGLIAGIALGVIAAVIRAQLDTSVTSGSDLHAITGTSTLGVVPATSRWRKKSPLIRRDERSSRAEAYRTIRTRLGFIDRRVAPRTLVVTSPGYEEASATTAANLALAISHVGARVCLVDADLREPRLAHLFGIEGSIGLTDVLTGERNIDDVLLLLTEHEINVVCAGMPTADPGALVGSSAMTNARQELRKRFDVVIFVSPALLWFPDGAVLSTAADGAILVARSGKTKSNHVRQASEVLEAAGAFLVGTVLTFARGRRDKHWDQPSMPVAPVAPAFRRKQGQDASGTAPSWSLRGQEGIDPVQAQALGAVPIGSGVENEPAANSPSRHMPSELTDRPLDKVAREPAEGRPAGPGASGGATERGSVQPPEAVDPTAEGGSVQPPEAVDPTVEGGSVQPPEAVDPAAEDGLVESPEAVSPAAEDVLVESPEAVSPAAEDGSAESPAVGPIAEDGSVESSDTRAALAEDQHHQSKRPIDVARHRSRQ